MEKKYDGDNLQLFSPPADMRRPRAVRVGFARG